MEILYLISHAGKAGTEKYVRERMAAYAAGGDRCHLAYWEAGELSAWAEAAGFPTLRLDLRPRSALSAARALARYGAENGIEVIHAQYPRENVIAVLSRLFRPSVRVVFTSHLTIRQGLRWRLVNRLVTPRDECVISVCTRGAAVLRDNGVAPEKIRVIFNGVDPGPETVRQNVIREEYGLPEETFVFLTMARYAPEKGLDVLADALSILKTRTARPFVCLIAGDGEEFGHISARLRALDLEEQVIQAGYRTDTEVLIRSADACVSTSLRNEAMSYALLEAMAGALPLAVTDVGAGRDLAEGCGFVFPPGDAPAAADALLRLLEDPEASRELGRRARERLAGQFTLERSLAELHRVYEGGEKENSSHFRKDGL